MADTAELDALKRRGRRRLIGAIALVLAAVIVLPMVFDQTPSRRPPAVSVRIPGVDERPFNPKPVPKPASRPAPKPASKSTSKPAPISTPVPLKPEKIGGDAKKETAHSAPAAAPKPAAPARTAKAAAPAKPEYVVPVAALANRDKVKELVQRLKSAKLPHYTEPAESAAGSVALTRVRVGPYSSKESAERAYSKLKRMGLEPGNVTTRAE